MIGSERLTYLPNLYYQLYQCVSQLEKLRYEFPLEKVLVPRQASKFDHLNEQMRRQSYIRREMLKYKKAVCYQLAKGAKEEVIKRSLKKEERYYFQRVAWSHLAEGVTAMIKERASIIPKSAGCQSLQKNRSIEADDIFIDKDLPSIEKQSEGNDLFGDILNEQPMQASLVAEPVKQIGSYLTKMIEGSRAELLKPQITVNRKQCLKKINENLRKRIKTKSQDETESNLNSATVLINNLISQEQEPKPNECLDVTSNVDYLVSVDSKAKKRKEQNFELKWSPESLNKFKDMNPSVDYAKAKFGSSYLALAVPEKDYSSVFDKNIVTKLTFPPSLRSVPELSSKFKRKLYYNTQTDPEYQKFIASHNKTILFEKFNRIASHILEGFDCNQLENGKSTSMAKFFLMPDGLDSDRIIFKLNNKRGVSLSAVPQNLQLSHVELAELSFFVRKYMGVFGSVWQLITSFISTVPSFSSKCLNSETIQELCQICRVGDENESSLNSLEMLQSKVLPHSVSTGFCSKQFSANIRLSVIQEEQETCKQENDNNSMPLADFDFDNYESIIEEPLLAAEDPPRYAFERTSKEFQQYYSKLKFPKITCGDQRVTKDISKVLKQFQRQKSPQLLEGRDSENIGWIFEKINDKIAGECKTGNPVRKRKHINDKSSELVKILHNLKQKLSQSAPTGRHGSTPLAPTRPTGPTPTVAVTPSQTPSDNQTNTKKVLPKKPQEKDSSTVKQKKTTKGGGQKGGQKRKKNVKDQQDK